MRAISYKNRKKIEETIERKTLDLGPVLKKTAAILNDVKKNGDRAVFSYTKKFDNFTSNAKNIRVSRKEMPLRRKSTVRWLVRPQEYQEAHGYSHR